MTDDDIVRMAQDAGMTQISHVSTADLICTSESIERFAALVAAAERERVAGWIMRRGFATGHGDNIIDMLEEFSWQSDQRVLKALQTQAAGNNLVAAVEAEREACAKVCDEKVDAEYATGKVDHNEMGWTQACAAAIRARGSNG